MLVSIWITMFVFKLENLWHFVQVFNFLYLILSTIKLSSWYLSSSSSVLPPVLKLSSFSVAVCALFPALLSPMSSIASIFHLFSMLRWVRWIWWTPISNTDGCWACHILTSQQPLSSWSIFFPPHHPQYTHAHQYTHTHSHLPRYPGDSDGCQLLCCRKLWPLYEDPWGYFIQDGASCTYCVCHKEPWVFFTQTLLFLVIRNALVVQLGYVDEPRELGLTLSKD